MNQILIGLFVTLVGAYAAYLLTVSHGRRKQRIKITSEFAESLRHTLPGIKRAVDDAYLFSNDLTPYLLVLKENELKLGYTLLPDKAKKEIKYTVDLLKEFVNEFYVLRRHIYTFFESMKNRRGQGSENINTILATKLACMDRVELPTELTVINFPRESRGHFSQVQCQPQQVVEIFDLGKQGNSEEFKNKRKVTLEQIIKLEGILSKLHRL